MRTRMEATMQTFAFELRQIRDATIPTDPIISESKRMTGEIEADEVSPARSFASVFLRIRKERY
jgi:hypothetical protein